jgi:hypothetical protein
MDLCCCIAKIVFLLDMSLFYAIKFVIYYNKNPIFASRCCNECVGAR